MQLSPKEFEYQFRCLYRPLNMYALRYTENLDDAEDIVQQAFSDVWEKLESLLQRCTGAGVLHSLHTPSRFTRLHAHST